MARLLTPTEYEYSQWFASFTAPLDIPLSYHEVGDYVLYANDPDIPVRSIKASAYLHDLPGAIPQRLPSIPRCPGDPKVDVGVTRPFLSPAVRYYYGHCLICGVNWSAWTS